MTPKPTGRPLLTVEECCWWLLVVGCVGEGLSYARDAASVLVCGHHPGYLRRIAEQLLCEAKLWRRYPGHDRVGSYERRCLTAWSLCRAAIRAIQEERDGRAIEHERAGWR